MAKKKAPSKAKAKKARKRSIRVEKLSSIGQGNADPDDLPYNEATEGNTAGRPGRDAGRTIIGKDRRRRKEMETSDDARSRRKAAAKRKGLKAKAKKRRGPKR